MCSLTESVYYVILSMESCVCLAERAQGQVRIWSCVILKDKLWIYRIAVKICYMSLMAAAAAVRVYAKGYACLCVCELQGLCLNRLAVCVCFSTKGYMMIMCTLVEDVLRGDSECERTTPSSQGI